MNSTKATTQAGGDARIHRLSRRVIALRARLHAVAAKVATGNQLTAIVAWKDKEREKHRDGFFEDLLDKASEIEFRANRKLAAEVLRRAGWRAEVKLGPESDSPCPAIRVGNRIWAVFLEEFDDPLPRLIEIDADKLVVVPDAPADA